MLETIRGLIDLAGLTPAHIGAVCIGLLASWGITQTVKTVVVLHGRPAALTAFLIGWSATYTVAPGWGWLAFWLGICVGLLAPICYRVMIAIGRIKGWNWTAALSGDP